MTAVDITLFGSAGDPAKGFAFNPTSCAVATTTIDATASRRLTGAAITVSGLPDRAGAKQTLTLSVRAAR